MSIQVQMALGKYFDLSSRPDPYPLLTKLREASPSVIPSAQTVVVGRYEHVSKVLRNRTVSSQRPDSPTFFSLDPPMHTRLRGLTSKAFPPQVVDDLEPTLTRLVHTLLDDLAGRDSVDIIQEVAYPITGHGICQMFGLPEADVAVFRDWARMLTAAIDPPMFPNPQFEREVRQARADFKEYFLPFVRQRRQAPGDDLVSRLVQVREGDDQLTEEEILDTCVLLAVASYENPVGFIGNVMLALLRHPDQMALVRADPSLAAAAVEETLRYDSPAQLTGRVTTEPIKIGELEVPAGFAVLLLLAAANRDSAVFADPDRFDLHRDQRNHLAFAAGPHFCIGSDLARLEARIAVTALAQRFLDAELVPDSLVYRPNLSIRGPLNMLLSGTIKPV